MLRNTITHGRNHAGFISVLNAEPLNIVQAGIGGLVINQKLSRHVHTINKLIAQKCGTGVQKMQLMRGYNGG